MADIHPHTLTAMGASIESLFQILGQLCEAERRSPLSMDKFATLACSRRKQQLGLIIDSRKMVVTLPSEQVLRMTVTLSKTWHSSRKSFTLLEGVTLLGLNFLVMTQHPSHTSGSSDQAW